MIKKTKTLWLEGFTKNNTLIDIDSDKFFALEYGEVGYSYFVLDSLSLPVFKPFVSLNLRDDDGSIYIENRLNILLDKDWYETANQLIELGFYPEIEESYEPI